MTVQITPHIIVRPAEPCDIRVVRQLFAALHAYNAALDPRFALAADWERVLDEHLTHMSATGHGLTMIAWMEDQPVGLLMMGGHSDSPLFQHRHWAELLALYVAPEVQGAGVADMLVDAGVGWARTCGYERIQLYVTAGNMRAMRFYRRAGFQPVQEIWRRELDTSGGAQPADPECEAEYREGHDLLAIHPHRLTHNRTAPHEAKPAANEI